MTQTADELSATRTRYAVSHPRQAGANWARTPVRPGGLFADHRAATVPVAHVRKGWPAWSASSQDSVQNKGKLRVAVAPGFSAPILMQRLRGFIGPYPEIDLACRSAFPLLDVVAEDADLMIRFGTGRYADVEHACLMTDDVTPWRRRRTSANTARLTPSDLLSASSLRSPASPWRTGSWPWRGCGRAGRFSGSSFNDITDVATPPLGLGVALDMRLKLEPAWLDNGTGTPLCGLCRRTAPWTTGLPFASGYQTCSARTGDCERRL